ncbi:MAG TPA: patatin-like phospholipase family protein [Pseudonocardiaceae bacterium]|jgi:NTE family protein|nr:patatin-like phospholipase family protein [Pseudonocardiaceae bacterium]
MTIAFVLAGGGSLAAAHVGMLRALTESGVHPDLVVGTSAGAINAFCFANTPTEEGVDRLEGLWTGLRRKDVFPLSAKDIVAGLTGMRDGLLSPERLRAFLYEQIGDEQLQDTKVAVHIIATDLAEGEPVVLSDGVAVEALLASSAMPGVFPPVVIDGRPFVDGAVTADTPIRQAEELGATEIYVLPTVGPKAPSQVPKGAVPVLLRAIDQMFGHVVANDLASVRARIHILPAPKHGTTSLFDFRSTERLIREAYTATRVSLGLDTEARTEPVETTPVETMPVGVRRPALVGLPSFSWAGLDRLPLPQRLRAAWSGELAARPAN